VGPQGTARVAVAHDHEVAPGERALGPVPERLASGAVRGRDDDERGSWLSLRRTGFAFGESRYEDGIDAVGHEELRHRGPEAWGLTDDDRPGAGHGCIYPGPEDESTVNCG
jgi:hypothetical protein